MKNLADSVIKFRGLIISLFIIFTILMAIPLKDSSVDPDVENMLPDHLRVHLKELEEKFGGMEIVFVVVEDKDVLRPSVLAQINAIRDALTEIRDIEKVNSIPMVDDDPFADEKPAEGTPEELASNQVVREKYLSNSFVLRRKDFQKLSIEKEKQLVENDALYEA